MDSLDIDNRRSSVTATKAATVLKNKFILGGYQLHCIFIISSKQITVSCEFYFRIRLYNYCSCRCDPGHLICILLRLRTQFILHKLIQTSITLHIYNIIKANNRGFYFRTRLCNHSAAAAVFLNISYVSC